MTRPPLPDPTLPREGDDYLWRADGPPDPEIERLEQTLADFRYHERAAPAPRASNARRLAAAAGLVMAAGALWIVLGPRAPVSVPPNGAGAPAWSVELVTGAATIDSSPMNASDELARGQWLETGAGATAALDVADIGNVTVHPNSRLRIVNSQAKEEHRVELAHGTIDAMIFAPPRLFFVDTPSAVAVDLGCAYTLAVNEAGDGTLDVTLGWVMLEGPGVSATVPGGARCAIRAGAGPGTPYFLDAPAALQDAVSQLDAGAAPETPVDVILHETRAEDRLTLWHLLPQLPPILRERVVDRMIDFDPLPHDVTREGVLALNRAELDRWWWELDRTW